MALISYRSELFYDSHEVAEMLNIAVGTLNQWRHFYRYPDIEYVRIGMKAYYSETMLNKLKAHRRNGTGYNSLGNEIGRHEPKKYPVSSFMEKIEEHSCAASPKDSASRPWKHIVCPGSKRL